MNWFPPGRGGCSKPFSHDKIVYFGYNLSYNWRNLTSWIIGVIEHLERLSQMAFHVEVDHQKCKGCEECVEVCTVSVFEMQERKAVPVNEKDCFGCQTCVEVCKEKAITVKELEVEMSEIARMLLKDIL